jgi:hypothetical protein
MTTNGELDPSAKPFTVKLAAHCAALIDADPFKILSHVRNPCALGLFPAVGLAFQNQIGLILPRNNSTQVPVRNSSFRKARMALRRKLCILRRCKATAQSITPTYLGHWVLSFKAFSTAHAGR